MAYVNNLSTPHNISLHDTHIIMGDLFSTQSSEWPLDEAYKRVILFDKLCLAQSDVTKPIMLAFLEELCKFRERLHSLKRPVVPSRTTIDNLRELITQMASKARWSDRDLERMRSAFAGQSL